MPDLLSSIDALLGAPLVSDQARSRLRKLDGRIPDLDNSRYLECRLGGAAASQVDYLISLTQPQAALLGRELAARGPAEPGMASVERLVASWSRAGSALVRSIPVAWLEFDHVEKQDPVAASVSVCLAPAYVNPYAALPRRPADAVMDSVAEMVDILRTRPLDETESRLFRRCIDALPDGAHWIHLSVMTAREPVQLKLYGVFPVSELSRYLREIAWPGTLTTFAQFLRRYASSSGAGDFVYLDLPLAALDPRSNMPLGLCFSQQHVRGVGGELRGDPTFRALLTVLARDGLCTSSQIEALIRWPMQPGETGAASRWLDIKLVYHDARPALAKAYLGFARRRPVGGLSLSAPGPRR